MKKLVLRFLLATAPVVGLNAQTTPTVPDVSSDFEINWQLDSLIPCHVCQKVEYSKLHRDSLNVHNFPLDSIPAYSSDAVAQRLKDIGAPYELAYNEDVQAYINMYTLQRREQVERMLGLSQIYFPIFEEELDRAGIPLELKYLPIVESALNPHARSRVGATGLWQFMLPTGQLYHLNVTSFVDERRDPYKATRAAVQYLKNMYKTYGDWLLCVAAYNCGPGNVNKAIARSGGKRTFWEIKEFLPKETRGYVPALIAATYVFNYSAEHNLFPRVVDFSFAQDTIQVSRQLISLKHFADITHTDFFLLKDLNPELKTDFIPYTPEPYVLRVPMETGQIFAAYRDSMITYAAKLNPDSAKVAYTDQKLSPLTNRPYEAEAKETYTYASNSSTANKDIVYHKVRSGEVVGKIASKYGVSAKDVAKWNGLRNFAIKPGQKLKIYVKGKPSTTQTAAPEPKIAAASPAKSSESLGANVPSKPVADVAPVRSKSSQTADEIGAKYHVVRYGDTLWDIANAYNGLTVEKLKSMNALASNKLEIGQKLRVQ
jgi:membrane-bound lytic murein transglycosylase D